jgi:diketogulonate reductase-like aldo/keto reductase
MSKRITALGKQPRETLVEQEGIFALAQIRQRIELPQLAIDFAGMAHNEAAVGQAIEKFDE